MCSWACSTSATRTLGRETRWTLCERGARGRRKLIQLFLISDFYSKRRRLNVKRHTRAYIIHEIQYNVIRGGQSDVRETPVVRSRYGCLFFCFSVFNPPAFECFRTATPYKKKNGKKKSRKRTEPSPPTGWNTSVRRNSVCKRKNDNNFMSVPPGGSGGTANFVYVYGISAWRCCRFENSKISPYEYAEFRHRFFRIACTSSTFSECPAEYRSPCIGTVIYYYYTRIIVW